MTYCQIYFLQLKGILPDNVSKTIFLFFFKKCGVINNYEKIDSIITFFGR